MLQKSSVPIWHREVSSGHGDQQSLLLSASAPLAGTGGRTEDTHVLREDS